jgi:hypothetical protein
MRSNVDEDNYVKCVFDLVKTFFESRAGIDPQFQTDRPNQCESNHLLPIAYMGSVEQTIQGELFVFLHGNLSEKRLLPVLEFAHSSKRRIDILILTAEHEPLVAIELKHHSSPKNSRLQPLLDGLDEDAKRDYPCSPSNKNQRISLIQVGLYTTIEKIYLNNEEFKDTLPVVFPKYKFIDSYAKEKRNKGKYEWIKLQGIFSEWLTNQECAFDESSQNFTIGASAKVNVSDAENQIYQVEGRINYFVGLRNSVVIQPD